MKFLYYLSGFMAASSLLICIGEIILQFQGGGSKSIATANAVLFLLFGFLFRHLRKKRKEVAVNKESERKPIARAKSHLIEDRLNPGYDPDTGEVWEDDEQDGSSFMDTWEDGLTLIWEGEEEIAFSYESNSGQKSRRTVTLYRVLRSDTNAIYFRGLCHLRNEERTFADAGITSKITHNGKRYDWEDFVEQRLGVRLYF